MSINKNISINASDCRQCNYLGVVTISPTLLTDREVTYSIHGHGNKTGESVDYTELYTKIENALNESKAYTDNRVEVALNGVEGLDNCLCERVKYEVVYKPEGTLVDYRDKEIRIMCPADTVWTKQSSGENSNPNMYYIGFRAYAPDDAVSFKETIDKTITDDTMYYFENNDFAGIDEYDRKYSIVWLPVAVYDETTGTWTYYGTSSSADKYIGWYYSVEWYDTNGVVIESDCVRISLSNESCHTSIEPSYMTNVVEDAVEVANTYTDEQIQNIIETYGEEVTDEDIENLFK